MRPFLLGLLACALAAIAWAGCALAQPYPNKPIRIVTPYVAGGSADITARSIGQKVSEILGVPVVIENRGGANGMLGTDAVAKASPNGYTILLVASGPIVINPALYPKVPYDPIKDLVPVTQATTFQYVMVVPASSPIGTLDDLLAQARAKPGEPSYGSTGIGGGNHLAGELLALMSGTKLTHVPYKGSAQALTDLLGGQLAFTFDTIITSVPFLARGQIRAVAVTGPKRASALPNVPTLDELGLKGFEITQWQGFFVPAGTDAAIVARLNEAINKALQSPDIVERLVRQGGLEIVGGTAGDFAKVIESDAARYVALIRQANVKPE